MTFAEAVTELRAALVDLGRELWTRRFEFGAVMAVVWLAVFALTLFGWI